jgi:hypothetical protein
MGRQVYRGAQVGPIRRRRTRRMQHTQHFATKHPRLKHRLLPLRPHQRVLELQHCRWHRIPIIIDATRASGRPTMRTTGRGPYPARIAHSLCPRRRRKGHLQVRWITADQSFEPGKFVSESLSLRNNLHLPNPTLATPPIPRTPLYPSLHTEEPAHAL